MTAAVAGSDGSRENIEKRKGRDEREGTRSRYGLMMEREGEGVCEGGATYLCRRMTPFSYFLISNTSSLTLMIRARNGYVQYARMDKLPLLSTGAF